MSYAVNCPDLILVSFSVVDARDVALAQIAAARHGRRGECYLAAGRHMTMRELVPVLKRIAGVKTPVRQLPLPFLGVHLGSCARDLRAYYRQAHSAEHGHVAPVGTRKGPHLFQPLARVNESLT